jgi:predicted membrane-bound mannosyltransferase
MSVPSDLPARPRVPFYWLAAVIAWLAALGFRPLFNPDEGRYAEIPREMLEAGNFVVPRLNDLVYLEKPPLQYWLTALGFRLLGISPFSARLVTALAAVPGLPPKAEAVIQAAALLLPLIEAEVNAVTPPAS